MINGPANDAKTLHLEDDDTLQKILLSTKSLSERIDSLESCSFQPLSIRCEQVQWRSVDYG